MEYEYFVLFTNKIIAITLDIQGNKTVSHQALNCAILLHFVINHRQISMQLRMKTIK